MLHSQRGVPTFTGYVGPTLVVSNACLTVPLSPGAPTIGTATAGNAQATVTFTAPASNGGSAITGYTVTSIPAGGVDSNAGTTALSHVVTGLTNGTAYTFTVIATNGIGPGAASAASNSVTPFNLVAVQSRKTHGTTGDFNLAIDATQLITGNVTVEPRTIGSGHLIVFQFSVPITVAGNVNAAPVGNPSAVASGSEVRVTLTGVPDNRRVTIALSGVNGSTSASASMGFLVGDVTNSRSVSAADISALKAHLGNPVNTAAIAKFDLNADGVITSADVSMVKARAGLVLTPP